MFQGRSQLLGVTVSIISYSTQIAWAETPTQMTNINEYYILSMEI
jgi:hypothetical protein